MKAVYAFRSKPAAFAWHVARVSNGPMNSFRLTTNTDNMAFPDNHMINGTKLLNVAGMTRGRRDGILKSEKVRHVVKIGPMHLKGVW
jgi:hypothetical protein